jgi:hypothetical protein
MDADVSQMGADGFRGTPGPRFTQGCGLTVLFRGWRCEDYYEAV